MEITAQYDLCQFTGYSLGSDLLKQHSKPSCIYIFYASLHKKKIKESFPAIKKYSMHFFKCGEVAFCYWSCHLAKVNMHT